MKDFNSWNEIKQKLDERERGRTFQEREVWWCSVGVNIGFEIYGKNRFFNRPVLVLRKFSRFTFLGAPLTSKCDSRPYRYKIHLNDKESSVILDQDRCFDYRRLLNLEGKLTYEQFDKVTQFYIDLIQKKTP